MASQNTRVGENALARTVRLLSRLNDRFADQEEEDLRFIDLRLEAGGGGQLHYATGEVLYAFSTPDQLTTFLEATQAQQAYAIAGQRK